MNYYALSIKQPWAWLIAAGHKDIENRSWNTNFRGKFLIHAGKTFDDCAAIDPKVGHRFDEFLVYADGVAMDKGSCLGVIIGEAEIVDCVTESESPWFNSPVVCNKGFVIANAVLWKKPIPYRGQLNFFTVTLDEKEGKPWNI